MKLNLFFGLILGAAILGVWYLVPHEAHQEQAKWVDPTSGTEIIYSRSPMPNSIFAEFNRSLIIKRKNFPPSIQEIASDTGGYYKMNIYRSENGQIFLRDSSHCYYLAIHLIAKCVGGEQEGVYQGRFDQDAEERLVFVPASEGPEIKFNSN